MAAVGRATLLTSRPLDEYCRLFGLSRGSLAALPGPVLDCPGGAAGLVAECRGLGVRAIAVDPAYAAPRSRLLALASAGREAMSAAMGAHPARYPAAHRLPPERYLRSWDRARRLFADDTATYPGQYVAAALPKLPFADGSFALTLSCYLLFAYPELFTPADQLAALLELARVTAPVGEARIYPLYDAAGRPCPHLAPLRAALGRHRITTQVLTSTNPYDGRVHRTLVLRKAGRKPREKETARGLSPRRRP